MPRPAFPVSCALHQRKLTTVTLATAINIPMASSTCRSFYRMPRVAGGAPVADQWSDLLSTSADTMPPLGIIHPSVHRHACRHGA